MITCESFRERLAAGTDDPALLEHLRSCDRCLDLAAHADPDVMFRALGGEELVPPGGIEAFVGDVMQQVRVRQAETTVEASHEKVVSWPRRLAVAAMLAVTITGVAYTSIQFTRTADAPAVAKNDAGRSAHRSTFAPVALVTKPVVETYESDNATIVELPAEAGSDDVKIVMIFDENLPADL
jgi:hypothetical protein